MKKFENKVDLPTQPNIVEGPSKDLNLQAFWAVSPLIGFYTEGASFVSLMSWQQSTELQSVTTWRKPCPGTAWGWSLTVRRTPQPLCPIHRWSSVYCSPQVGIDIDLNVGDIRHLTSTSVIPISEEKISDWKPSFRYLMSSDIDIRDHSDIRCLKKYQFLPARFEAKTLVFSGECITLQLLCWSMNNGMSDIGYRIQAYSYIRYNVGLCSFQSDIGSSDTQLSPISLITDIGLSAHLCCSPTSSPTSEDWGAAQDVGPGWQEIFWVSCQHAEYLPQEEWDEQVLFVPFSSAPAGQTLSSSWEMMRRPT